MPLRKQQIRGFGSILWTVPLTFFAFSCNLFETRDPEPPSQSATEFLPPTLPRDVITNLKSAIAQKSPENYVRSFADTSSTGEEFRFIPSSTGNTSFPGVFIDWSRANEDAHFRDLLSHKLSQNSFSNLSTVGDSYIPQGDSTVYTATYTLTFDHNVPPFPYFARGRLQFMLKRDRNGFWVITEWTDSQEIDTVITWTHFKGKFR